MWATNEPAPVMVEGQGLIDMTAVAAEEFRDRASCQFDERNDDERPRARDHSNHEAAGKYYAPTGKRIAGAKLLVAGTAVPHYMEDRIAVVEVPSVAVHEVVAFDLM